MNGRDLAKLRKKHGWTQTQLADVLNEALERSYKANTISEWERRKGDVPDVPAAFLEELGGLPPSEVPSPPAGGGEPPAAFADDAAPGFIDQPPPQPQTALVSSMYAATCEGFFEMIGALVGMIGATVGNDAVKRDGAIIIGDKKALGAAYGKLAETNEVFRNLIMSADKQGAYLAVAIATGTTAGRIWQNHQTAAVRPPLRVIPADEIPANPA
jgi:hypothetical protein